MLDRQHLENQRAALSELLGHGLYEQALMIARELGDRRKEQAALGHLARRSAELGRLDEAIEFYKQALEITREIGDRQSEVNVLSGLANCHAELRQLDDAAVLYAQAMMIAREIGDRLGEVHVLAGLASTHAEVGRLDKASTSSDSAGVTLFRPPQPSDERSTNDDDASAAVDDPLAAAKRRGEIARRSLLAAQGELLDAAAVAARLGLSVAEVEHRRESGLLLALSADDNAYGFPSWQFADGGLLPGLEAVFRDIGVRDPWMQAAYFLSGDPRLAGQTPLEMLRRGEAEAVRRAATAYGEQLAS